MKGVLQKLWPYNLGVAAKLYFAIGGAVAFTSAASIVAWISFVELGSQQKNITTIHLPAIINSLRLAQKSTEVAASAPLLLTAEKETDRAKIFVNLSDVQSQIVTIMDSLEQSFAMGELQVQDKKLLVVRENDARFSRILLALAKEIGAYEKVRSRIEQAVELTIGHHVELRKMLVQQLDDQVFYIATGLKRLDQNTPDDEKDFLNPDQVLDIITLTTLMEETTRLAGLLAESSIVPKIELLVPLNERIQASIEASGRAVARLKASSKLKIAIQNSMFALKRLSVENGSIPAMRSTMLQHLKASKILVAEGRRLVALIALDVHQIVQSVQRRAKESVRATDRIINLGQKILLAINLIALVGAVSIGWFYIRRAFTEPIHRLTETAREFEKGHFNPKLLEGDFNRLDEFGQLVRTFVNMGHEVQARTVRLDAMVVERTKELKAKTFQLEQSLNKFEEELAMAQKMQISILPRCTLGNNAVDVYADMHAAREIGGDFYDFMDFKDGRFGIAIADVSDKGVSSALMMAGCVQRLRAIAYREYEPSIVMEQLNSGLSEANDMMMFVTAFYGVIDTHNHTLTYANAGHEPPILMRQSSEIAFLEPTGGIALGVNPIAKYQEQTIALEHGDVLFCYTDGITDALNEVGESYGVAQLQNLLSGLMSRSAKQMCEMVISSVGSFTGAADQFDDITCLAFRYRNMRGGDKND